MTYYAPLTVTAIPSNRKEDQVVGFIGQQLVFFETDSRQPEIDETVTVMLTRPLYRRNEDGSYDFSSLTALLVREVTDDYALVEHDGFKYDVASGVTLARAVGLDYPMHISPGRTGVWIMDPRVDPTAEPRPGAVYVLKDQMCDGGVARCEGLASAQDATYTAAVKE